MTTNSEYVRRIATYFYSDESEDHIPTWRFEYDLGGLEHMRYKHDHTGYTVWWKRWKRGLFHFFGPSDNLAKSIGLDGLSGRWAMLRVQVEKDRNLPDARVGGSSLLAGWMEDAEYVVMMQPRVGVEVANIVERYPDLPEVRRIAELWEEISAQYITDGQEQASEG